MGCEGGERGGWERGTEEGRKENEGAGELVDVGVPDIERAVTDVLQAPRAIVKVELLISVALHLALLVLLSVVLWTPLANVNVWRPLAPLAVANVEPLFSVAPLLVPVVLPSVALLVPLADVNVELLFSVVLLPVALPSSRLRRGGADETKEEGKGEEWETKEGGEENDEKGEEGSEG